MPIASCQMLPNSTFYSPPYQWRRRTMYHQNSCGIQPPTVPPFKIVERSRPRLCRESRSCRPATRKPCSGFRFASPLHEKETPGEAPGVGALCTHYALAFSGSHQGPNFRREAHARRAKQGLLIFYGNSADQRSFRARCLYDINRLSPFSKNAHPSK